MNKKNFSLILFSFLAVLVLTSALEKHKPADHIPPADTAPSPITETSVIPPSHSPKPVPTPAPTPMPTPAPTEPPYEGELVAEYALQYDGYDYLYGGKDPETGFAVLQIVRTA